VLRSTACDVGGYPFACPEMCPKAGTWEPRDRARLPQSISDGSPQERPPSDTADGYGGPPRIARTLRIGGRYAPYPSEASAFWPGGAMVASAPSLARFADALLRGDLLSPDSRQQLLRFVPAGDGYDGYGLGVGKGQQGTDDVWYHFGAGPGFVTVAGHVPAKEITVAALSSGDADLRLLTTLLTHAALEAD
jgi:hypothetical protein